MSAPLPFRLPPSPMCWPGGTSLDVPRPVLGKRRPLPFPFCSGFRAGLAGNTKPIRALILTPTRELALQIQENFTQYGKYLPVRTAVIFGGVGQTPQIEAVQAGVDVLVATPGRLMDLRNQGHIDLTKLDMFVLDEADRMLDMGFIRDVRKIISWLPQKRQTLLFSATMPREIAGALPDPSERSHTGGGDAPVLDRGCHPAEAISGGTGGEKEFAPRGAPG